jgi:hypothetical protein
MVTTRSHSTPIDTNTSPPADTNPITTNNIIMTTTEDQRLAAEAAAAATAAVTAAAAAAAVTAAAAAAAVTAAAASGGTLPVVAPHLGSNLSNVEVASFFKDKDSMNCQTTNAVTALSAEGITIPEDLIDFEDDDIDNMARNLSKIPNPNTVRLSAICVKRLKIAAACARFYKSIGRDLSKSNMSYSVMSIFWKQWQALESQKKSKDKTEFPKMDRNTSILKWTEAAANAFDSTIGSRTAPLSYVLRPDPMRPDPLPPLEAGKPWSTAYGSIRNEMEFCLNHDHPVFDDDNRMIFNILHDALQGTTYGATINPFKRKQDGMGAWRSLNSQHAGKDRWDAEVKRETTFLTTQVWKGNGNITLAKHSNKHRNAFISLETCAIHVDYQLPNERTRVKYLLDSIRSCTDAGIQARLANIEGDDTPNGKRNNFEDAVTHLLPADPVTENNNKRRTSNGSGNRQGVVASVTIQSGKGKSGVNLRWHPTNEYKALNDDQRDELKAWRNSKEGKDAIAASKKQYLERKGKTGGKSKRTDEGANSRRVKFKKMIASVVTDTLSSHAQKTDEEAQINAITASMFSHMKLPPAPTVATVTTPVIASASSGPTPQKIAQRLVQLMKASGSE